MCSTTWHKGWWEASSGRLLGGDRAPWICFSAWNAYHPTTAVIFPCYPPGSLGSAAAGTACACRNAHLISLLCLAEGSTSCNLFSHNQIPPLSRLGPAVSSQLLSCVHGSSQPFSLLTFPFVRTCPPLDVSVLRSFKRALHQARNPYWTTAVQIVRTSRGETKGTSHTTILLTSLLYVFV